jgi:hypothetical protein
LNKAQTGAEHGAVDDAVREATGYYSCGGWGGPAMTPIYVKGCVVSFL